MVRDPTMRYCKAKGCTNPPLNLETPFCRDHHKAAKVDALREANVIGKASGPTELCPACSKAKKVGEPCKVCEEALAELREGLEVDTNLFDF